MARKMSQEEQKVLKALKKLGFKAEDLKAWEELIESGNMNEEMAKDIIAKLDDLAPEEEVEQITFSRNSIALKRALQAWRLAENLRNIGGRRR